jgi:hypothetical protein
LLPLRPGLVPVEGLLVVFARRAVGLRRARVDESQRRVVVEIALGVDRVASVDDPFESGIVAYAIPPATSRAPAIATATTAGLISFPFIGASFIPLGS